MSIKKQYHGLFCLVFFIILFFHSYPSHAHFALAPKISIQPLQLEQPDARLLQSGDLLSTRAQFTEYLKRITAFDTKYDRVQTNFFSHFEAIRGIALFHPDNVHKFIDNIASLKSQPRFYQLAVNNWIKEQALMYARISYYFQHANNAQLAQNSNIQAVLDFYAAGAKTEFLEELVVLGSMPATVEGVVAYVEGVPLAKRNKIDTGIVNDTEVTPVAEQERMKKRWLNFRQQVLDQANAQAQCQKISSASAPPETVIIKFNQHQFTLGEYLAIFDKPHLPSQWKALSRVNCNRLILFHAMADLVDQLGILPDKVQQKISISKKLYLASHRIIQQLGPHLVAAEIQHDHTQMLRKLMAYPEVIRLKDRLIESTAKPMSKHSFFLDKAFISATPWSLKRTLAPKHSIHF